MQKITLTIKDNSKLHFFLELLKQFDLWRFKNLQQKARHLQLNTIFLLLQVGGKTDMLMPVNYEKKHGKDQGSTL